MSPNAWCANVTGAHGALQQRAQPHAERALQPAVRQAGGAHDGGQKAAAARAARRRGRLRYRRLLWQKVGG